jgi:crotonobetainyl-CoA:carnitine CoA-transferase CaiB-like acyl-CoA transferase
VALLAALHLRERTGRGQHIDLTMLHAMVATDDYAHHLLDGALPPVRLGGQVLEAPGGPILVSAQWPHLWSQVRDHFAVEAEPGDTLEQKIANRQAAVRAWARGYTDRETLKRDLEKAGLSWGDVRSMDAVFASPTLQRPGTVAEVPDGAGGRRRVVDSPYRFSDARSGVRGGAPRRGEHNAEVLGEWLGAGDGEIGSWRAAGVLLADAD